MPLHRRALAFMPSPQQRNLALLKQTLTASGVWAKLDAIYVFSQSSTTRALRNLKVPGQSATIVNSPTFLANQGFLPDTVSQGYIDTGINPSTAGGNFTQNNACMFGWSINYNPLADTSTDGVIIGQPNETGGFHVVDPSINNNQMIMEINDSTTITGAVPGPDLAGLYHAERTGVNATSAYFNGAPVTYNQGGNQTSSAIVNTTVTIGFGKFATPVPSIGSAGGIYLNPIAAAGFGSSLGVSGALSLYNALNSYMTGTSTIFGGPLPTDPYTAFARRLRVQPAGARQTLYSNLINGLISDGVWSKIDALVIFAANDIVTATTNLVQNKYWMACQNHVANTGQLTFTVDRGVANVLSGPQVIFFTATSVGGAPWVPSIGGTNFTQNSAHIMFWSLTNSDTGTGADILDNSNNGIFAKNSNNCFFQVNGPLSAGVAVTDSLGMYMATRVNSSTVNCYKNGTLLSSVTNTSAASGSTTGLQVALGLTTRQYAVASFGGALTATDATNLYTRVQTYLHAVGAV